MTPAAYVGGQPVERRKPLATARAAIAKALPRATQSIKYGMIAFSVDGKAVVYLGAWKKHYALYPGDKSTQFAYDAKVPVQLIAKIAKARLAKYAPRTSRRTRRSASP